MKIKRIPYEQRLAGLCEKAKEEIIQMLNVRKLRHFDIPDGIYVLSQKPGADFEFCQVYWVGLLENTNGNGDILAFDYKGGIAWYKNPIVWLQICDYLRKALK